MTKFFIAFLILISPSLSIAQFHFNMPLKKGNQWVYRAHDWSGGDVSIWKMFIGDTVVCENNETYFKVYDGTQKVDSYGLVRKSSDGNYYSFGTGNKEYLEFNPNALGGDSWFWEIKTTTDSGKIFISVTDIFNYTLFGEDVLVFEIVYEMSNLPISIRNFYCEKFGMLGTNMSENTISSGLKGCIIDGVVYGDTTSTLVGVESDDLKPNNIILGQNYPNPFNPSTTIPFRLNQSGRVKMTVYDVSGREIRVLKDGFMAPGNHDITFQADEFPSGLYLVRLEADGQVLSKKMMLLK